MRWQLYLTRGAGEGKKKKNSQYEHQLKSIKELLQKLVRNNTIDLVGTLVSNPSYRVVVPVETQYFATNESPASLIDGQFIVLGKVVRNETGQNAKPINLLRGTAFAYLPDNLLNDLQARFEEMQEYEDFKIPGFVKEIEPPAFQVIPIAIFA